MHIPRNKTELEMYRQAVIKEYKLKHPRKKPITNKLLQRMRRVVPVNIALGVVASILFILDEGWNAYYVTILTSVIWISLVGAIIGAFFRKK